MKTLMRCCMIMWALSACTKPESSSQHSAPQHSASTKEGSASSGQPNADQENANETQDSWPLEGEWRVQRGDETVFVFKFYGSEASVRYVTRDNLEVVGDVSRLGSNGFVISPEGGRRHIFRYVIEGKQVFIGRGNSHSIEDPTNFAFNVTNKHRIHYDGQSCALKKEEKQLQTVDCTLDLQATPPLFTYDSPIPPQPGPKRSRRMFLVGKTLVNQTLYGYKATRVP